MSARHSRRALFGAGMSTLLLAAQAAGAAKAQELNGDLIAACERLEYLEAEYARVCPFTDSVGYPDAAFRAPYEAAQARITAEQNRLVEFIANLPARTPEGLRAKASAALTWHRTEFEYTETLELAEAVLRDLSGRAGA